MFRKILIANRGEIAIRIIRACKEMSIKTVAVFSTADKESMHVKLADEAFCIGGPRSNESYLNTDVIIEVANITNANAIHPGYGFLAENAEFSEKCAENNIKFIGPSSEMIRLMGDKATAKTTMKKAGVPVIPGSDNLIKTIAEGKKLAKQIGYPVILKATAGGGGKGMRLVSIEAQFQEAWENATREAESAFGNAGLYLEKFLVNPHHIEIQILGDQFNNAIHLSERDCSVQRRHQKLIEETPSPFINNTLRNKMGEAAIKAAQTIGYEGAGTVEFLVDEKKNFYFMEMNTRIQVEHCITEEVTGLDLLKEQIKVAAGEKINFTSQSPQKHAIECRINAEDTEQNFRPDAGKIKHLFLPGGKGVRIDTHIYSGYSIPPYYDSLIAKFIATGNTRTEAIQTMKRMLSETQIEGIKTTIPFHLQVLKDKDFATGNYNTGFLEKFLSQ
ncbi:MAG: acetyl-CoA carboxylase biotin carboxylase subunit [Chlorobi bacterium]|nr:acetyl-CoA carboxylase biotin carboxylase subunit [Chlorobiota bacterium]